MTTLLLKALVFFWPFLKNIIFKDRSITEVVRQNRHATALFVMLVIAFVCLLVVVMALGDARTVITQQRETLDQIRTTLPDNATPHCTPLSPYDKSGVVELLNNMDY